MERTDRGSILISTLVAAVVGGLLAVGASVVIVQSQADSATPVQKPLVAYDSR